MKQGAEKMEKERNLENGKKIGERRANKRQEEKEK